MLDENQIVSWTYETMTCISDLVTLLVLHEKWQKKEKPFSGRIFQKINETSEENDQKSILASN